MTTNRLEDGKHQVFRCFAAAMETAFTGFRENNRHNLRLLSKCKTSEEMRKLISASLPGTAKTVRVHVAGDFFSQRYFDAWMRVAETHPGVRFYAYTKSIPFWLSWLSRHGSLPKNFTLTASMGGKFDHLSLPEWVTAKVVFHPDEAKKLKLKVDKTDTMAQKQSKSFALILHAVQPKGTKAADAIRRMKDEGIEFSYG